MNVDWFELLQRQQINRQARQVGAPLVGEVISRSLLELADTAHKKGMGIAETYFRKQAAHQVWLDGAAAKLDIGTGHRNN